MKKIINGVEIIDGKEMMSYTPNFYPVIAGFAKVIGEEKINEYLHDFFGEEAKFYPEYMDISLGESNGWASLANQLEFINFIINKLEINTGYNYKKWVGKYEHIICK